MSLASSIIAVLRANSPGLSPRAAACWAICAFSAGVTGKVRRCVLMALDYHAPAGTQNPDFHPLRHPGESRDLSAEGLDGSPRDPGFRRGDALLRPNLLTRHPRLHHLGLPQLPWRRHVENVAVDEDEVGPAAFLEAPDPVLREAGISRA